MAYLFCSGDTLVKNGLLPASKDIKYHIIIMRAQVYNFFSGVWRELRETGKRGEGGGRLRYER